MEFDVWGVGLTHPAFNPDSLGRMVRLQIPCVAGTGPDLQREMDVGQELLLDSRDHIWPGRELEEIDPDLPPT